MSVKFSGYFKPCTIIFKPTIILYKVNFTQPTGSIGSQNMGTNFSSMLSATSNAGDIVSYSLISGSLPSGVSLNTLSGQISGVLPSVQNDTTYDFVLKATDSRKNSNQCFYSLTVLTTVTSVQWITESPLGDGNAGVTYVSQLKAEVKRGA